MADQNLTVRIQADASQAISSTQDLESRLAALEQAFIRQKGATETATIATDAHAEAQRRSTVETRVATEAATGLGGALDALATHYRMVSSGAEVFGLETAGAAGKVAALTEVVEGLEHAFAPLLVAIVAFQAAFSAFDELKEGVSAAADLQSSLASLQAAVENSGGSWDDARESVMHFAEALEQAYGVDINESVAAVNRLVVAGASLRDAEYEVTIATQTAAATHQDLKTVIEAIIEAEAGRATGLARLDARLKPLIQDHAHLSEIMAQLAQDMAGQATAAANTYEGSVQRLHAAWESFRRDIGSWLIPWLTDVVTSFIGIGDEISRFAQHLVGAIAAIGAAYGSLQAGDFKGVVSAAQAAGSEAAQAFGAVFENSLSRGHAIQAGAAAEIQHMQSEHGTALDFDPITGLSRGGRTAHPRTAHPRHAHPRVAHPRATHEHEGTFVFNPAEDAAKTDELAAAEDKLNQALKALGTSAGDLALKHDLLTAAIEKEKAAASELAAKEADAKETYEAAREAFNEYGASLGSSPTPQEKQRLTELRDELTRSEKAWHAASAAVRENTRFLEENESSLNRVTAQQQRAADEIAKAHKKALDEMEKAYQKWFDQSTKEVSGFLDDVLVKHKSFKDELKTIYDDILKAFIDMVAKMIVESNLFKSVFGNLGGGGVFGGGSQGGGIFSFLGLAGASHASAGGGVMDAMKVDVVATGGTKVGSDGSVPTNISQVAGKGISAALGGAAVGGMFAGMTGGSAGMGALGGALGSIAAVALHANPLIGAGIEAVTGVLGGMIGPHWGPASYYPDRSQPGFGQWLANYQGGEGLNVNGATYTADTKYDPRYGGTGIYAMLANWALSNKGSMSSLDPAQQQIEQQILGLLNGQTSAGALGIAGIHNGVFTLTSGATISSSDLQSLVTNYQNAVGGANGPIPTFSISRSYPDYNLAHMAATGSIPGTGASTVNPPVTVNVTVQGPVVGSGGMNELATTISQTIARQGRGLSPVGGRYSSIYSRNGGGF